MLIGLCGGAGDAACDWGVAWRAIGDCIAI